MNKLTTINFNGLVECNVYGDKDNPLIDPKPVADFLGFRDVSRMCEHLPDKYKVIQTIPAKNGSGSNYTTNKLFITEKGLFV